MRKSLLSVLAAVCMFALPFAARADDKDTKKADAPRYSCSVDTEKGDRLAEGKDLVIKAGQETRDAVVIDGVVTIRKGAVVDDVVAIRGRVVVESGARVKGDVVALGGDVRLQEGARVEGDAMVLGGKLDADDSKKSIGGETIAFSLNINGEDFMRSVLESAFDKEDSARCHISINNED